MKYYASSYFHGGKQIIAESFRSNKRLAAKTIARYLNINNVCSWHSFTIAEVYETLIPINEREIAKCGVGRFLFLIY